MTDTAPAQRGLPDALTRYTGFLLSRMGVVTQKRFAARLEEVGLTPRMWGALNVLDAEGPMSQNELCNDVGMDPSSMVSTIDELEAKGLVQRRRHPSDRRAHALHVTGAGRKALAQGRHLAAEAQEELLAPLDQHEREQLHSLLLRLAGTPYPGGSEAGDPTAHAPDPTRSEAGDPANRKP